MHEAPSLSALSHHVIDIKYTLWIDKLTIFVLARVDHSQGFLTPHNRCASLSLQTTLSLSLLYSPLLSSCSFFSGLQGDSLKRLESIGESLKHYRRKEWWTKTPISLQVKECLARFSAVLVFTLRFCGHPLVWLQMCAHILKMCCHCGHN